MKKTKINDYINKEEKANRSYSTDVHMTLDPSNPNPLTPVQKQQLCSLSSIPDSIVRKEAETDPDCEPLDEPGTVE